jgi:hypothetical protein
VRAAALEGEDGAHRALAAGLELAVRGLEEDGEVAVEPAAPLAGHPAEAVERRVDLLVVVEDEREVVRGLGPRDAEPAGQAQHHRVTGLHVGRAAAVEQAVLGVRGHVVGDRHGVEVAGEHDAGVPAEVGAGEHRVAQPLHLQSAEAAQGGLDGVGQCLLVPGDRGGVDEGAGQLEDVGREVEVRCGAHDRRAYGRAEAAAGRPR